MERVGSVTSNNEFFTQFLFRHSGYVDEEGTVFVVEKRSSIKKRIGFVDISGLVYSYRDDDSLDFVGHVDRTGDVWIAKYAQSPTKVGFVLFSNVYVRGDIFTGERTNVSQYCEAEHKNREIQRKIIKWGAAALLLTSPMYR